MSEEFVFLIALGAFVIRHILDNCYSRYFKLIKHFDALYDINIGKFLRCCYYNSSFKIDLLTQSQLNISGSRREIDNKIVKLTPIGIADHLSNQARHDGPSHDCSSVTFWAVCCDEAITHCFYASENDGLDQRRV
jgi:hypothetical protein